MWDGGGKKRNWLQVLRRTPATSSGSSVNSSSFGKGGKRPRSSANSSSSHPPSKENDDDNEEEDIQRVDTEDQKILGDDHETVFGFRFPPFRFPSLRPTQVTANAVAKKTQPADDDIDEVNLVNDRASPETDDEKEKDEDDDDEEEDDEDSNKGDDFNDDNDLDDQSPYSSLQISSVVTEVQLPNVDVNSSSSSSTATLSATTAVAASSSDSALQAEKVIDKIVGLLPFRNHMIAMVIWEGEPNARAFIDSRDVRRRSPEKWTDYLEGLVTFPKNTDDS